MDPLSYLVKTPIFKYATILLSWVNTNFSYLGKLKKIKNECKNISNIFTESNNSSSINLFYLRNNLIPQKLLSDFFNVKGLHCSNLKESKKT